MEHERHSWIEVEKRSLLRALRKLARLPKLPIKQRPLQKFILRLDDGRLVLGTGLHEIAVTASGVWDIPAVFPFHVLGVMVSLVDSADPERPVLMEGVGDYFQIGATRFTCSFQNPKINIRGVENAERARQIGSDGGDVSAVKEPYGELEKAKLLAQMKELHPKCFLGPSVDHTLVIFPDLPHLIVRLGVLWVEFRMVTGSDNNEKDWLINSRVLKRMPYTMVFKQGVGSVLAWMEHTAIQRTSSNGPTEET